MITTRLPKPKGMYVYCTTQFEFLHKWENAPSNVMFLRTLHRHIMHVKVMVRVDHANRNVEFIGLKRNVDAIILDSKDNGPWSENMSCEQLAESIASSIHALSTLKISSVEVSEDNENGAVVTYE